MRILTTLAMAVAMVAVFSATSTSEAQQFSSGYRFGAGLNFSNNFRNDRVRSGLFFRNFGFVPGTPRLEEPPYFAKFPPVHYSKIVRRPYGISPYAAPPGVVPVEMTVAPPAPKKVLNPYFEKTSRAGFRRKKIQPKKRETK